MLTPEIVQALRAPFPAQQIKWKLQTTPTAGDVWATVVAYLDARDVAERLDHATGGNWSDDYAPPTVTAGDHTSLLCSLTVCGITRRDVGTVACSDKDDATKDLHSDAFKRAAVKFGVASHVYRFPSVQARVEAHTYDERTSYRLTKAATQQLNQLTQQLLAGAPIAANAFSDLRVWGNGAGADGSPLQPHGEGAPEQAVASRPPQRTARPSRANGTATRLTNGAGGTQSSTAAPPPAKLARARQALREAEQASGVAAPAPDGATQRQRQCIQRLIADLSADEATVQGLAELFSAKLSIDGAALLSDPQVALQAPLSEPAARTIIRELQALR